MPKPYTFPTLFDNVLQISITKLKELEYLKPNRIISGTMTWSRNGNNEGRILIKANTNCKQPYIELNYKYRNEPRNYKVQLVSVPSNLGKGNIWYFICPETNKLCRKIYSINGFFLHREAFKGCMYESQTQSKESKQLEKVIGAAFTMDQLYNQLYKKHFKKFYAGKPTKRYLRIKKQIHKIECLLNG